MQRISRPVRNVFSGIFSMFLSVPQWGIKISWTFKFISMAVNFIIVALSFKFSTSTTCHYKIMKQKVSERPVIRVHISVFFIYTDITLKFIYFFSKILYFWLYSQKVCHFHHWHIFQFLIRDHKGMPDSCTFSICSPDRCVEMKHDHKSWLTKLPPA
jgi:hypothetical protein